MKTNQARFTATVVLALAAVLAFFPAFASDNKAVSTMSCRPLNDANAAGLQFTVSGIKNTSGVSRSIVCPLPRDQNSAYSSEQPGHIAAWYKTGVYEGSVRCTSYSGSIVSNALVTATAATSRAANTEGTVSVDIPDIGSDWSQVQINMLCAISPQVTLGHFYFDEPGATD